MSVNDSLKGKVAIITGAAQGLGEAIAREFVARGAAVIITDVQREEGEAVAADILAQGGKALFIAHDVGDAEAWDVVVAKALDTFGKVDVLVNNAGLIQFAPLEEMPIEMFDRVTRVNVRGPWLGCKAILPALKAAGGGAIINMSSMNGMIAQNPGLSAYATSKGAVRMLTKAVAQDYVQYGVRVNSVHPGTIASTFVAPFLEDPNWRDKLVGRTPMARAGEPSEVAKVVAFLASDDASYMTGSEVAVDGGFVSS
uniref:D-xylose 1-dehydrogenase n=1 Tax=Caulobacter sp. (strain K31) TaxID=366602 RepID=B0T981_CAUSK